MDIQITIPDVIEFESRGESFAFDLSTVKEDKLADLVAAAVVAGFTKAGIDSGSNAAKVAADNGTTVEDETRNMIESRFATWRTGSWGASSGSAVESAMVRVVSATVKGLDPKAWKDADTAKRRELALAHVASLPAKQVEAIRKHAEGLVEAERERREREKQAAAEIAALLKE